MMGVSLAHRVPRVDWKDATPQSLFKHRLAGKLFNFGFVTKDERSEFLEFIVDNNFVSFIGYKEYRGTLAQYDVLEDFAFNTSQEGITADTRQWLAVTKDDVIELTELLLDGKNRHRPNGSVVHKIWTDVTPEERAEIYDA